MKFATLTFPTPMFHEVVKVLNNLHNFDLVHKRNEKYTLIIFNALTEKQYLDLLEVCDKLFGEEDNHNEEIEPLLTLLGNNHSKILLTVHPEVDFHKLNEGDHVIYWCGEYELLKEPPIPLKINQVITFV